MALSDFELHPSRLSTTGAKGERLFLYPADVKGFYRTQRIRVQIALIIFFLILPWIKIQGRQAILLNITERHFEIFGLSLRAHNAPLLIFVLAAAAFGLFFATAVFGRVWCGWACPQTVFIDGLFRRIERWVEGSAPKRQKLADEPLSVSKILKRTLKWSLYIICTLIITHSFLAYFVGTESLEEMILRPPAENLGSFLFMLISSLLILFDFAWFREQFCTILCPYGRLQSVLMDGTSTIVAYDIARGEPRRTQEMKQSPSQKTGDCVNCYRCVQVCPTGIDIRRGLQMECIACTACMDACDEVMTKINKPTGLIRYDSLIPKQKKAFLNLRAALYLTLCLISLGALITSLALIKPVDIEVLRAKDSPYTTQTLEDGTVVVVNHYLLELSNQSGITHNLAFSVVKDPTVQIITAEQPLSITDSKVMQAHIFIRFPKSSLKNGIKKILLLVKDTNSKTGLATDTEKEVTLVGPFS